MSIVVRSCDDWVAIYRDGRKVDENHSLDVRMVLDAAGVEYEYRYFDEDEMDYGMGQLKDGTDPFPERL